MSLLKHMERWKDVEGFEGLYQVSTCGRVKSLNYNHTGKEKILKPCKRRNGYLFVNLWKDGKKKSCTVHRLVAQAFIPNPLNLPCVNHKNEIKTDNFVSLVSNLSNLEWCTREYNCSYGTRNERIGKGNINHPSKSKKVLCIETNKVYPSSMEVQRIIGIDNSHIIKCCKGKRKTAGKFHWRYV